MRKGFSLVEVLVLIVVLPFVAIVLDKLFVNIVQDIPRLSKVLEKNTTVLHMLDQMQSDIDNAEGLPDSVGQRVAGEELLLIELKDGTVAYELENGRVLRRRIGEAEQSEGESATQWLVPDAAIKWRRWKKENVAYAVEVETHIGHKLRRAIQKKMANSHVYFLRAL